jgi:hypothetical protein
MMELQFAAMIRSHDGGEPEQKSQVRLKPDTTGEGGSMDRQQNWR